MRSFAELLAGGIRDARLVPGVFDGRQLEPEAEPEERDVVLAGKLDRLDLALDTPLPEIRPGSGYRRSP
jgi:hypothetical protein